MKKILPTLLLVLVLIVGFFYARSQDFFREQPEAAVAKTLLPLNSDDVVGLKWSGSDGAVQIELKKNGEEDWEMLQPAAYPVSSFTADGMPSSIGFMSYKEVIEENPAELALFGLDKPMLTVEAVLKDGSSRKLLVGNPLPVAGSTYVKLGDAPAVYEVEDPALQTIQKQALDFVDLTVFNGFTYDKVKSVEMEWKGEKWTLSKSDLTKKAYESAWKLGDKELKPEDGSGILDSIRFVSTDRLPKPVSEVPLDSAELKLTVKEDDNGQEKVITYRGRIDNQLVRIAVDGGHWAFAAGADQVQEIFDRGKQ